MNDEHLMSQLCLTAAAQQTQVSDQWEEPRPSEELLWLAHPGGRQAASAHTDKAALLDLTLKREILWSG